MKILLLHPNFPGQFKNICKNFADLGHDVKFICQTHYGREIKSVERITVKCKGGHDEFLKTFKTEDQRLKKRAHYFRNAFIYLSSQKTWSPDLVISHCAWGCGAHIKEIWPNTKMITYMEWWFSPDSELINESKNEKYFNYNSDTMEKLWHRNSLMAFEMTLSDYIVAPTEWQRNQLPLNMRKNVHVIYDGIDSNIFYHDNNKISQSPKITYGTRGMEPIRGFPEFIQSLPILISKWPSLKVEIAGKDEICYGGIKPPQGSWKKWAIEYLDEHNISTNILWVDRMGLDQYAAWLKSSWCHVYLTRPYVVSWSLQEAIFCGVPLVVNKSNAVSEFCERVCTVTYCENLKPSNIANAISVKLRDPDRWRDSTRQLLNNDALIEWGLKKSLESWSNVAKLLLAQ